VSDSSDDLRGTADSGTMSSEPTAPDDDNAGDLSYDEVHQADDGSRGVPGDASVGPADQGSQAGPSD
jgi:hypothetical protein